MNNFIDILEKEICIDEKENKRVLLSGIEIPMIQRDYAQGRKNAKEMRNRFLSSIFEALEKKENLTIDFIYGSVNEASKFLILDGQQRLTTLFLLYWYIASRELSSEDKVKIMSSLSKFTYATRDSASRFCENLVDIKKTDTDEPDFFDITPQERLRNLPWFFLSYEKDPTIKSMFTMLDAIHEKYSESENKSLFDGLQNITFYILPMNDFKLTDELYVKMNARGKQLTPFENFKADLIKWMKAKNNPHTNIYNEETELNGRKMDYYMSFSQKIDNDWANFFWTYSKTEKDEKDRVPDRFLLNFFNRYLLNFFVVESEDSQDDIQKNDTFKYFYGDSGDDSGLTYCSFKEYQTLFERKNIIHNIEKCLDCFSKHYASIIKDIAKAPWGNDWDFFQTKLDNLSQRVVFLAITLFIEKNEINDDFPLTQFKQWMRVVWNIVENIGGSIAQIIPAMRLINELSEYTLSIYEHLKDRHIKDNSFASEQMREEKEKARKILEDSSWEQKIIKAENYAFWKGCIRFLFTDRENVYNWNLFDFRFTNAQKYFNENGVSEEYRKYARLVCTFISLFTKWEQCWGNNKVRIGNGIEVWEYIFRNSNLLQPLSDLLDLDDIPLAIDSFSSKIENFEAGYEDIEKLTHEDMCHNGLINEAISIMGEGVVLNWKYNLFVLYRPKTNADWKKYVIGNKRNKILFDLRTQGIITTKTKEHGEQNISELPYFWGWNIYFTKTKDGAKYQWWNGLKRWDDTANKWEEVKDASGNSITIDNLENYLCVSSSPAQ